MVSIVNAPDLPSDDEEDQDYDPSREEEADGAGEAVSRKAAKRGRGVAVQKEGKRGEEEEGNDADPTTKDTAKKAKISALWEQLKQGPPASAGVPTQPLSSSLAALCRPASKHSSHTDKNRNWMKQLGYASKATRQPGTSESKGCPSTDTSVALEPAHTVELESQQRAGQHEEGAGAAAQHAQSVPGLSAAAAALAAAKAAASSAGHLQAVVTETRRFAGKDIQMTVSKAEAEAEKQARNKAGLDAVLASLQAAKKANVLDKSRSDWTDFKQSNTQVEEELEKYKKSGDKYLDKVDFLKRTELKEYEKERDARLGGDIRSRGRL